jgi:L-ornithine N5-monooxygenase
MYTDVLDLIGVGFGPAGIALAAAFEDWREEHSGNGVDNFRVRFLERRADSGWQGELLLPGTDISHHFLRDLALPRNPRSRFTFPNYLKEKGRLFAFGLWDGAASRLEWSDYVEWVAALLADCVSYNTDVISVEPVIEDGQVRRLKVITSKGELFTDELVLNTGQKPKVPEEFQPFLGDRFFHTTRFLPNVEKLDRNAPLAFVVIGSGQSAAESLVYLHDEFRQARLFSVHRRIGFKLLDDGHFSQQIYFPEETDYFYNLNPKDKAHALQDIWLTNYATIDLDVSRALYHKMYEDRVRGRGRVFVLNRRRITDLQEKDGRYVFTLTDVYSGGEALRIEADVVVLCTGFQDELCPSYLDPLKPYLSSDSYGLKITRDYRIETGEGFRPRIFLNGLCERTHGMSDSTSFSMMALKAERIFQSWLGDRARDLATTGDDGVSLITPPASGGHIDAPVQGE